MVSRRTAGSERGPEAGQADVLALLLTPGVGPVTLHRIVAAALAADVALGTLLGLPTRRLLAALPASFRDVAPILAGCRPPQRRLAKDLVQRVYDRGGEALLAPNAGYPDVLNVHLGWHAPPILFVQGNRQLIAGALAGIVGARRPSRRGRELAAACAESFANRGVPVVSGGARGIDLAAHLAALAAGGETVVVLPQGLLSYRIPEEVGEGIARARAAIVSEFAPGDPWTVHAAVTRNATIAALSRMLCVVEPKKTGGSVRTARAALGQGKRVLMYGPDGQGRPHELLRSPGVRGLLDSEGRLDVARLLECWQAPRQHCRGQSALC